MKTPELAGAALDWAVAKANGMLDRDITVGRATCKEVVADGIGLVWMLPGIAWSPTSLWSQGGPIIEREKITPYAPAQGDPNWSAFYLQSDRTYYGPTPLIAAMRCYVASKLGEEVEIPEELGH